MVTAKWKHGFESIYKDVDPNKVYMEICSIGATATAQQILSKARDENTELHKCFEWDDSVAAEKWRLYEARQVVCKLVIEEPEVPVDRPEVRMFHRVSTEGYTETRKILVNEESYKSLLNKAFMELKAFRMKYETLTELAEIFELIDELM